MRLEDGFSKGERGRSYGEISGLPVLVRRRFGVRPYGSLANLIVRATKEAAPT